MGTNGRKLQIEPSRNLLVGKAVCREFGDLGLAWRQSGRFWSRPSLELGARLDALQRPCETRCDEAEQTDLVAIEIGVSVFAPGPDVADTVAAVESERLIP